MGKGLKDTPENCFKRAKDRLEMVSREPTCAKKVP